VPVRHGVPEKTLRDGHAHPPLPRLEPGQDPADFLQ